MLKSFTVILALIVFWQFQPLNVSAHSASRDKAVGAILHIEPDDNPTSNTPETLTFYFSDLDHKFNLQNCDCRLIISNQKQHIQSTEIKNETNSELTGIVSYSFPAGGIYQILVEGQPHDPGMFVPFRLNYNVNVKTSISTPNNRYVSKSYFFVPVAIFAGGLLFQIKNSRK